MPLQIGGVRAPSPVGELGNVEMTQAITLVDSSWQVVGPDVLLTGRVLADACAAAPTVVCLCMSGNSNRGSQMLADILPPAHAWAYGMAAGYHCLLERLLLLLTPGWARLVVLFLACRQ